MIGLLGDWMINREMSSLWKAPTCRRNFPVWCCALPGPSGRLSTAVTARGDKHKISGIWLRRANAVSMKLPAAPKSSMAVALISLSLMVSDIGTLTHDTLTRVWVGGRTGQVSGLATVEGEILPEAASPFHRSQVCMTDLYGFFRVGSGER